MTAAEPSTTATEAEPPEALMVSRLLTAIDDELAASLPDVRRRILAAAGIEGR